MPKINAIPTANQLEIAILEGALHAQKQYEAMTDGWWLWHGPESFLQVVIAQYLCKRTDHVIYVDTSIKKLKNEMERGPGRPADNTAQRPDVSVWYKTRNELRAAIEIKRTWSLEPIVRDANKIERWMGQTGGPDSGYILVYSEAKGLNRANLLSARFNRWADNIGWVQIGFVIERAGVGGWTWGIVLLRCTS